MRKVVEAFARLLEASPFEQISMSEVAREAGVSVGTIYTRFPSKDHLLLYLVEETFYVDVSAALDSVCAPPGEGPATLDDLVYSFFSLTGEIYHRSRNVFGPFSLVLRMSRDEALLASAARYNDETHRRLTDAMLQHRKAISHDDPELAIGMALLWGLSALREMILYAEPVSHLAGTSREQQIKELCHGISLYLMSSKGENNVE